MYSASISDACWRLWKYNDAQHERVINLPISIARRNATICSNPRPSMAVSCAIKTRKLTRAPNADRIAPLRDHMHFFNKGTHDSESRYLPMRCGHFEVDFESLSCSFVSYGFARILHACTRACSFERFKRSRLFRFLGDLASMHDSIGHSDTIASRSIKIDRVARANYGAFLRDLRVVFLASRSNIDGNF